jgi:hypothetical protein
MHHILHLYFAYSHQSFSESRIPRQNSKSSNIFGCMSAGKAKGNDQRAGRKDSDDAGEQRKGDQAMDAHRGDMRARIALAGSNKPFGQQPQVNEIKQGVNSYIDRNFLFEKVRYI